MKILVVTRELPPVGGGAGHVALHLAEAFAEMGHHLVIVTMHFDNLPLHEHRSNLQIYRIKCGRKHQDSSYPIEMLRFVFAATRVVRKLIHETRCDIIHAHGIVPDGLIALASTGQSKCPFILTAHGSDVPGHNPDHFKLLHKLIRPLWNKVALSAKTVVAPSNHLVDLIKISNSRISLNSIPNGIATDLFTERQKRSEFLIVSRLIQTKNYQTFFEALRHVPTPQIVHVVGDGPMLPRLQELSETIPQHKVTFHGWLASGSTEWRELFETCRFFIFPSKSENFPVNLLEAQLAKMVILASDIPGNREILGDDAIYFKSLDTRGISEAILSVLAHPPEQWDAMTSRAQNRLKESYSWRNISEAYLDLYTSLLS